MDEDNNMLIAPNTWDYKRRRWPSEPRPVPLYGVVRAIYSVPTDEY